MNIERKHGRPAGRLAGPVALLAALLLALPFAARAANSGGPIPVIDGGGHMSIIRGIAFLPDDRLVSVGEDKLIRIWDLNKGSAIKTIRGQIEEGQTTALYAMAVSPDHKLLAIGGALSSDCPGPCGDIRLHDLASGEIVGLLKGHKERVLGLAFSADGHALISGSRDKTAIVWDMDKRAAKHVLRGHTDRVKAVGLSADGQFAVTAAWDNAVRTWNMADGSVHNVLKGHTDKIMSLAVSPVGFAIASGGDDKTIRLWNGIDGSLARVIDQGTVVASLSFSPDGTKLLSGAASPPPTSYVWQVATGERLVSYPHDNSVMATAISADGRLAATAGGNRKEIHIWEIATGKRVQMLAGQGSTMFSVAFSKDGKRIAWGKQDPCPDESSCPNKPGRLEFEMTLPSGDLPIGEPRNIADARDFDQTRTSFGKHTLTHRKGSTDAYINLDIKKGRRLVKSIVRDAASVNEHNAYGFTPDGKTIISAGNYGRLTAYDITGNPLREYAGHTATVWDIAISPDGRLIASVGSDQTLRLWNTQTGERILSMYHALNGEWIMWTPQGYYAASPDGDSFVGWQINRGADKTATFISAGQLKQHLYNPEIIRRALIEASAEKVAPALRESDFSLGQLEERSLPAFELIPANEGVVPQGNEAAFTLRMADTGEPIEKVVVMVNGRRIDTKTRGLMPIQQAGESRLTVPLGSGLNRIEVTVSNKTGETKRTIEVANNSQIGALDRRGVLYLLAIGVNDYPHVGSQARLDFAVADAKAFADKVRQKAEPLYSDVKVRVIASGADIEPTKNNIEDELGLFFKDAKAEDTSVVFLAGHGDNEGNNYYYLPTDARRSSAGIWQPSSVVKWSVLQSALTEAAGRRIMFVDTCHAANAFNARMIYENSKEEISILSATTGETSAEENKQFGHGVFTYALLKGLDGAADVYKDGRIKLSEIALFLSEEVVRMTNSRQKPRSKQLDADDIVFAVP